MPRFVHLTVILLAIITACSETTQPSGDGRVTPEEERTARITQLANSWPTTPAYGDTFNALDPVLGIASATGRIAFDPSDDYWGLPRQEGYELVDAYCSACHTLQIVMQQSATPERWDYTLNWMVTEQGMAPMPENDRAAVLFYLSSVFGTATE